MKLTTPEIVWHSKEPLLSADFHRGGTNWRLATGGADNDVKIWKVSEEEGGQTLRVVFMASLSRHTKTVNVVRFSPNGELLASAGDDSVIHIWTQNSASNGISEGNLVAGSSDSSPSKNKENWSLVKLLRGHLEDVYDLCWSPDSSCLVSGSVDNSAIVWDVQKGQQLSVLKESRQYIQGVTWDPLGEYVATLSTDRNMRVYSVEQKFKCVHTVNKLSLSDSKQFRLWADEGLNSFFRRLTFTPDGSFLIAPAGKFESGDKVTNASYVFARNNLTKPVLQLPGTDKPTVAVRCCPVLFELLDQPDTTTPLTRLPYRMVYAVASLDSVLLYDTQHTVPFAYISKIHYSGITDLAWSNDGLTLVITSSDCYCTIVTFDPNELGVPLPKEKLPASMLTPSTRSPIPSPPEQKQKRMKNTDKATSVVDKSGSWGESKVRSSSEQSDFKSPSPPPLNSSQTNTTTTPIARECSDNSVKHRRIRPTMISSVTSPNGKIESNPSSPVPTQPDSSSQPLSMPDPPSQHTLSPHTPSQTTQFGAPSSSSKADPTTLESTNEKLVSDSDPQPMNLLPVTSTTNKLPQAESETKVPRRVNFITLQTFPKTAKCDSTNGGEKDKEDCMVIE